MTLGLLCSSNCSLSFYCILFYNKFSRINWSECPGTAVSYLGMHLLQGQYCFPSTTFLIIPYNVVWNWVWDNILRISSWYFNLICHNGKLQVGWDSVMRMSADKRELFLYEAFLYFNPLLLAVSFSSHYFSFYVCVHTWIYLCMDWRMFLNIYFYIFFTFFIVSLCFISFLCFRLWWFGFGESTYGFLLRVELIIQKYLILIKIIWLTEKYGRYQLITLTHVIFCA